MLKKLVVFIIAVFSVGKRIFCVGKRPFCFPATRHAGDTRTPYVRIYTEIHRSEKLSVNHKYNCQPIYAQVMCNMPKK